MRKQGLFGGRSIMAALSVAALCAAPAQADVISNGLITLDVNAAGSIREVSNLTAGFWNFGYPTIGFGFNSSNGFGREDANVGYASFGGSIVSTATTITATGSWGSLDYSRVYSLSGFSVLIDTVITNNGTSTEDFKFFDSGDPDQGIPRGGGFASFNDVNGLVAKATNSSGVPPDLVQWSTADASAVLTFTPGSLGLFDGGTVNALFGAPYDPNFANEDIGMAIIWMKSLRAGQSITLSYKQSYGTEKQVPEPAGLAMLGAGLVGLAGWMKKRQA